MSKKYIEFLACACSRICRRNINSDAELAGIWDGSDLAGNLGVPNISNLEDILCDESINGVLITAPTTAHEEITACAKAGKHIFTEKVLTLTFHQQKSNR